MKRWTPPTEKIARQPGWDAALVRTLSAALSEEFAWGKADCMSMQSDICFAMTGVAFLPPAFRRYRSAIGAAKLMLSNGFSDIEGVLDAVFETIPVSQARRGDCGLIDSQAGLEPVGGAAQQMFAVTLFGGFGCARGLSGPVRVPLSAIRKTWAVG